MITNNKNDIDAGNIDPSVDNIVNNNRNNVSSMAEGRLIFYWDNLSFFSESPKILLNFESQVFIISSTTHFTRNKNILCSLIL